MSYRAFGVIAVLLLPLVIAGPSLAQTKDQAPGIGRFIGTWKEDVSQRKVGSIQSLVFRHNGSGGIEELRGSELKPLIQPVNFTGKPYTYDPSSKNTIAWRQIDASNFERDIFNAGKLLYTRRLRLSADGQTLTEATELLTPSGKGTNTIVYRRTAGDQGLVGRWNPQSFRTDLPPQMIIEAAGTNGLKITSTNIDSTITVAMDNKPVPVLGLAVIPNSMVAARLTGPATIEITNSREGVETGTTVRTLSADGKTMTVTSTELGQGAGKDPFVQVFLKQ